MHDFDHEPDDFVVTPVPQPPPLPPLSAQEKGESLFWVFALLFGFVSFFFLLLAGLILSVYFLLNKSDNPDQIADAAVTSEVGREADSGNRRVSESDGEAELADRESNVETDRLGVGRVKSNLDRPFIPNGLPEIQPAISNDDQLDRGMQTFNVKPLSPLPATLVSDENEDPPAESQLKYDLSPENGFSVYFSFQSHSGATLSGNCQYSPTKEAPADAISAADDFDPAGLAQGGGTGFLIHPDGIVVTCAHVVENMPAITVTLGQKKLPAKLLSVNHEKDLALLKVNVAQAPYLALDNHRAALGEPARVFGFPLTAQLGRSLKMSTGSVSGFDDTENGARIQMDAVANPGNSGGPVTNNQGAVIGVVDSILTGNDVANLSFAVPTEDLIEELEKIGVPYQNVNNAVPTGDDLLVSKLQEVSHAVVRVGHSEELADRWKVVKFDLKMARERVQGKLLVDQDGNCINLGDGMFASKAVQDLTKIGFLPLPTRSDKPVELEDAALLGMTVVERQEGNRFNSPMDLHQQMLERMNQRIPGGIEGFGGMDPFRRNRPSTSTTTREVIHLARWTDKLELATQKNNSPDAVEVDWQRNIRTKSLSGQAEESATQFDGMYIFDKTLGRLKSGHLRAETSRGTTLSFSIKSADEIQKQLAVAAARQKEMAAEQARQRELMASQSRQQTERLDQLESPAGGLQKLRLDD